ncbi:MAG: hypothetical protein M3Y29_05075, partial [Chloroflexota bacterium]|nr:hypothetical protein [Chloroflexota bacterium]
AMAFIAAGVFVGLIGSVAWLAGQAFPRAAVPLALCVFALGATTAAVPSLQPFMPWGWVGLIYPTLGTPHLLAALAALATALVLVVPVLMNRLALEKLMAQAVRWDSAALNATVMDFGAATAIYRRRPHLGRRLRAVRPLGRQAAVFLVRDAIGATRTPGRLIVGVLALVVSGALITLALAPATPGWALGATAGLVLFAGLGPLTDGIRHAVHVAADFPIYGFSDGVLLANHMLFPLTVVVIVLFATVITGSLLLGNSVTVPVVGSLILGALALIARVSSALKGPMPPALLTPMTTPMGDLGAGVRLIWALEGVLFASLIGASVALALQSPILLVSVAVSLVGVGLHRWRHRV